MATSIMPRPIEARIGGHGQEDEEMTKGRKPPLGLETQEMDQLPSPTPTPTDPFPSYDFTSSLDPADQTASEPLNGDGQASQRLKRTEVTITNGDDLVPSTAVSETLGSPLKDLDVPGGETPKTRARSATKDGNDKVRKLSASQMQALTNAPESLPVAIVPPQRKPNDGPMSAGVVESVIRAGVVEQQTPLKRGELQRTKSITDVKNAPRLSAAEIKRPPNSSRTLSTPPVNRRPSSGPSGGPKATRRNSFNPTARPAPLNLNAPNNIASVTPKPAAAPRPEPKEELVPPPSPIPAAIPLPPMSIPTHLQLELAGQRPSPLYIHHSQASEMPYESSAVKFERLKNALLLPPHLEKTLNFGTLACLDAWLYTFTILPLRFWIAIGELVKWWGYVIAKEARFVVGYVWEGIGRYRGRRGRAATRDRSGTGASTNTSDAERSQSRARDLSASGTRPRSSTELSSASHANGMFHPPKHPMPRRTQAGLRHKRSKSMPSNLTSFHKADILQGLVVIFSSIALMRFDASRLYHVIRAQSAMKLYVIYNTLEVADRLLSSLGQDIFECLFSSETLSRNSSGRSKILLPFGMFILALIYNVIHAVALFYQVITLNVAINSYSNALLTLLMSNQFVEIKGTVFKMFPKENVFQLTCADVVERFQLWIMLFIIGLRNVVEVGGFWVPGAGAGQDNGGSSPGPGPIHTASILPASFTLLPSWLFSGEVLSPFVIVIGSEMLVDWIKHAYINKFNNIKPKIYSRFLDILCKDYYTNAFVTPSLTRRLGLPVLPLSCLFIRAMFQIYNMFLATHLPSPLPTSTQTSLSVESATPSSAAMVAALDRLDNLIRTALGRAVYGDPGGTDSPNFLNIRFTSDDVIALLTMATFFFIAWLMLLVVKLLLGMALLKYSRERYAKMKRKEQEVAAGKRERESFIQPGKRVGGFGAVEIGDERRRWIYEDDPAGLKKVVDRDKKVEREAEKAKEKGGDDGLSRVMRYEMVAKRIW